MEVRHKKKPVLPRNDFGVHNSLDTDKSVNEGKHN